MSNFKVGDKVRVKSDLVVDEKYDGCRFAEEMEEYKGSIFEIKEASKTTSGEKRYMLNTPDDWYFSKSMLEKMKSSESNTEGIKSTELFDHITIDMCEIYKKKNEDYGNSFSEQFSEYGMLSSCIRLEDKLRRLKRLSKHESKVKDESLEDTLLDLANYSIMTIIELRKNNITKE